MEEPILAHPDWNKQFKLYIDALDTRLEIILIQDNNNKKKGSSPMKPEP